MPQTQDLSRRSSGINRTRYIGHTTHQHTISTLPTPDNDFTRRSNFAINQTSSLKSSMCQRAFCLSTVLRMRAHTYLPLFMNSRMLFLLGLLRYCGTGWPSKPFLRPPWLSRITEN